MAYQKFFFRFVVITSAILVVVILLNYVVDPLQFYRKAQFYQPSFSTEQRYQNPGLTKNYDYDTIIIGSSMTENFVPSYINNKLGVRSLKLSMSGASAHEEKLIINLALRTGKVKNIIWGLDFASMRGDTKRVGDQNGPFPYYLYDGNRYNDFRYLASTSTLKSTLQEISGILVDRRTGAADMNYLNNWNGQSTFSRKILMKQWYEEKAARSKGGKGPVYGKIDPSYQAMRANFDQNICPLIKENPGVSFIMYYPPYSILRYRSLYEEDKELFYSELDIKKYIFNSLHDCENVLFYDFQNDRELTFNLDRYKDFSHHSQDYNEYIIDVIAKRSEKYLLTDNNINLKLQDLRNQVETLKL